ncbi:DUF6807 family protein [Gramella sp. AN32]|nr:DUF6807 family protein [Gramella sp. AN32]MCM4154852.1 hypothetical protein [Gramella sp. AN32]
MNIVCNQNLGIFLFLFVPYFGVSQNLEFQDEKEGLLLLENGQPRYFYRSLPYGNSEFTRANYIHPLYGLDGEVLTEDFPEDHPHHHGIFWAWHQLYAEGKRIADPWLNEGITWRVVDTETQIKENRALLFSEIEWIEVETDKVVIKEDLIVEFERIGKDMFSLNLDIELTALIDGVAIGGSEDKKGYGGFSARINLPEDVSFRSRKGNVEPTNLALEAGPWIDISRNFGSSRNDPSGITIMGEPTKLPSYKGWILRNANSMQNMAFPGQTLIAIPKGETLRFRNQLLIHRNLNICEIDEMYKKFSN